MKEKIMTATDESMMKQNCLLLNKCYETTASSFGIKSLSSSYDLL